jgi:two-component sensor histidine kinase
MTAWDGEARFQSFFEEISVPLFEEDFSAVRARLAPLAEAGELDEARLLAGDAALARECVALTRVVAINAEARRFFTYEDGTLGPGTEPGGAIAPNFREEGWPVFSRELLALMTGELPFEGELALVLPHGRERTIAIRVSVPTESRSSLDRVFVSFVDITGLKRAESELKRSLSENEDLIRELRHRTRNNMQIISSMLRFEEERAPDDRSAEAFRSVNDRIQAMATVHEVLSMRGELSRVDLASYARELVDLFMRNLSKKAEGVTACVEAQEIFLSIDKAVPFGLAVGELVSNSLRHAFGGRKAGHLWLRIASTSGEVRLEVEDDGIGFPERFDFRAEGKLGIQNAVLIIEEQLGGSMALSPRSVGTKWTVSFPLTRRA